MNRSTNKENKPYAYYQRTINFNSIRAFNKYCKDRGITTRVRLGNSYLVPHDDGITYVCAITGY